MEMAEVLQAGFPLQVHICNPSQAAAAVPSSAANIYRYIDK